MTYSMFPEHDINRAFLAFSIEIALLRMGKPQYEKVVSKLEKEYQTYLPDCDKNPEVLKRVLQDIFGDSYDDILSEIKTELGEASEKKYYSDFLNVLAK
ncbi:MAG: hypothetical protein ACKOCQ_02100 [Candidatus Nitrosotenuis sp.]